MAINSNAKPPPLAVRITKALPTNGIATRVVGDFSSIWPTQSRRGEIEMREWENQSHVTWYCRDHVVIVPK
jgi:hypothetical protein